METRSKTHLLSNGVTNVTFVSDPSMGLFVVTDCSNLGPDWIKITYRKGIYTTCYLLGSREDIMCPIARFLAPAILGTSSDSVDNGTTTTGTGTVGDIGFNDPMREEEEKEITLSISLRKTDPTTIREIATLIREPLDIVPVHVPSMAKYEL